jgi:hypothetical protein
MTAAISARSSYPPAPHNRSGSCGPTLTPGAHGIRAPLLMHQSRRRHRPTPADPRHNGSQRWGGPGAANDRGDLRADAGLAVAAAPAGSFPGSVAECERSCGHVAAAGGVSGGRVRFRLANEPDAGGRERVDPVVWGAAGFGVQSGISQCVGGCGARDRPAAGDADRCDVGQRGLAGVAGPARDRGARRRGRCISMRFSLRSMLPSGAWCGAGATVSGRSRSGVRGAGGGECLRAGKFGGCSAAARPAWVQAMGHRRACGVCGWWLRIVGWVVCCWCVRCLGGEIQWRPIHVTDRPLGGCCAAVMGQGSRWEPAVS